MGHLDFVRPSGRWTNEMVFCALDGLARNGVQ